MLDGARETAFTRNAQCGIGVLKTGRKLKCDIATIGAHVLLGAMANIARRKAPIPKPDELPVARKQRK